VTLGGAAVALFAHGWRDLAANSLNYLSWITLQVTIGQAYNPGMFREVGVGVMNASLWTITTEILFYISVPLIVWFERYVKQVVLLATAVSFVIYLRGADFLNATVYRDKSAFDILALTPVVWGWMFGCGILVAKHFARLRSIADYFPLLAAPMILMMIYGDGALFGSTGNRLGLLYFLCYISLIWAAFRIRYIQMSFDLSYGAYIWHIPINLLFVLAFPGFWGAILLTLLVACASWLLIKKPALKLKKRSINPRT